MPNKNKVLIKPFGKGKYVHKDHRSWSFGVLLGISLGTYAIAPTFNYVKPLVYPVYAVEPDNQTALEGVGESSSSAVMPVTIATPSASLATPSAQLSDKEEVMAYILEVFKDDAADAITMLRKCENSEFSKTHVNQNANGSKDYSPMQINDIHVKRFGDGFTKDWKENVRVAKQIFDEQGWSPWSCSRVIGVQSYWE